MLWETEQVVWTLWKWGNKVNSQNKLIEMG